VKLPKAGGTYSTERLGISAVQSYAAHQSQIWRETNTGDVGVDGNIEFVSPDGFATGRLVAIQAKAGVSYFEQKKKTVSGWKFYPSEAHRNYWENFPLPVLLVLHDPDTQKTYWTDARQALRNPGDEKAYIEVPSTNVLDGTEPFRLFENAGVQNLDFVPDIEEILTRLLETKSCNSSFPLSYFDLFVHGLTNICRSLYYGTDAIVNAVEFNLEASSSPFGMGMGNDEQEFAFGFVKFLLAQNLAQVDYSDCLIDWVDRQMQPQFVAPLTSRGRSLVKIIGEKEDKLVADGKIAGGNNYRVAQEGFFGMVAESYFGRFSRIKKFQDACS
jgi:hypothetical protein